MKVLGIEAVNIRNGGGLNHLCNFLEENSKTNFFNNIIVFTNTKTKSKLAHINNIQIVVKKAFDLPYFMYITYQFLFFKNDLRYYQCDLIFVPGSIFVIDFPNVLMPQNMLPYEKIELRRFSFFGRLKLSLIGIAQKFSLKKANGVIFLSEYALKKISAYSPLSRKTSIPHGIAEVKNNYKINSKFSSKNPMKILYVSPLYPYKHHEILVKAIDELIKKGLNIQFKIVGGGSESAINSLKSKIISSNIEYVGGVSPREISKYLYEANVFIFASTCENLPITMLEAMSHGLPIISSNYGVMPEVLDNSSNFFFNPTSLNSTKEVITKAYFQSDSLNLEAKRNLELSRDYTWESNAIKTNEFLKMVYEERF